MPCFKPLDAWRTSENTSKGKKKIVFKKSGNATGKFQVPCGQCIGCRQERSQMWAIRCVHESQMHQQNCFITLTYSEDNQPWDGSLIRSHFTKFMKRLRKWYAPHKIRYYMCGEYGEKFTRPHYHACLFGIDFPDKEVHTQKEGIITYTSEILSTIWGKGYVTIGDVNFHTAAYIARYISKKITGPKAQDHYKRTCDHTMNLIQIEPEYSTMSRKPGIGMDWLKHYVKDVYPSDYLIYKGRKLKVPRFYDHQLTEEALDHFKIKRKEAAKLQWRNNTPERLATREKIKTLKVNQLKRGYET